MGEGQRPDLVERYPYFSALQWTHLSCEWLVDILERVHIQLQTLRKTRKVLGE
jgi:hypothetical protein